MATTDYENLLRARGFELTTSELLPAPAMPVGFGVRTPLATGRRTIGSTTIELQLQQTRTSKSVGLAAAARIIDPRIAGQGQLRLRPVWGTIKSLMSGPKAATYLLIAFLFAGVWIVMLPGMLLVWWIMRRALARQGLMEFRDLVAASARARYAVWGKERGATKTAITSSLQSALASSSWYGICEVNPGEILLDTPFGYTRTDIFTMFLDAALSAAESTHR
jgi:hypothetical protein